MILLPKYRDIEVPIALKRPVFKGHFIMEAVGLDGRVRKLAEFDNLITTNGANLLGNSSPLTFCLVGTGNTPPTVADTSLQSFISSTSSTNFTNLGASSVSPYFGTTTIQYNFPIGTATGNLSEVGIGQTGSNTNLFSRALILDGGGSPTTITVLSSEALYVTYQLNQYVPLTDVTGTIVIASVSYGYTLRGANATGTQWAYRNGDAGGVNFCAVLDGAIGAITTIPAGTESFDDSISNNSYSVGSFTLSGTATFGLTKGNFGTGIASALVAFGTNNASRGNYQIGFSPTIPKDASHVLTLSFSTTWAINTP